MSELVARPWCRTLSCDLSEHLPRTTPSLPRDSLAPPSSGHVPPEVSWGLLTPNLPLPLLALS